MVVPKDAAIWDMMTAGREIRDARNLRDLHVANGKERLAKFGAGLRRGWKTQVDDYVNFPYLFYQNTRAAMVYNNPRFKVSSRAPMLDRQQIMVSTAMLNRWALDTRLSEILARAWFDISIDGFAVVCVGTEEYGGPTLRDLMGHAGMDIDAEYDAAISGQLDAPALRPYAENIDPGDVLFDSRATHWRKARWAGHTQIMTHTELLEQGVSEADVLRLSADQTDWYKRNKGEHVSGQRLNRGEYLVAWVWRRQTNTIHLYGFRAASLDEDPIELREPRPYKGHRDGPYVMMGVCYVRGQIFFMSPLAPTDKINTELDKHRGQIMQDAGSAKRILITKDQQLAEAVENGLNNTVWASSSYEKGSTEVFEWGGPQEANILQAERLEFELQRVGGVSSVSQGQVGTGDTATEVAEASARLDTRLAVMQSEFRRGVVDIAERALEHMLFDPQVRSIGTMTVNGVESDHVFMGGDQDDMTFRERLSLEVVPYSSEFVSNEQQKQRALELIDFVRAFVESVKAQPIGIDWQTIWQIASDANNWGEYAGQIVDVRAIIAQAQLEMEMGLAAPGAPGGGGGPPTQKPKQGPAGSDVVSRMRSTASSLGKVAST